MAQKASLRKIREGTVINDTSEKREGKAAAALNQVITYLTNKFEIRVVHENNMKLFNVIAELRHRNPNVDFFAYFETSSMRPDGGILSILDNKKRKYPILITEVKNQGTNDLRLKEGKLKQAKGNAIERLGKNVIGFRTALLHESIFPFICFGDGCDFAPDSSILDRVVTISMFGKLNKIRVHNEGNNGQFNRGSFFFREKRWTASEMAKKMITIAESSIFYYFSKYGKDVYTR
jgi:type II restriction enzyme